MKSILKHERRNMIAVTIFFSLVVLAIGQSPFVYNVSAVKKTLINVSMSSQGITGNLFLGCLSNIMDMAVLVAIPMALYVAYLHGRDKAGTRGNFMAALPIKKEKVFLARWWTGMIVYTIPWILLCIVVFVTRVQSDAWYQEYVAASSYGSQILGIDSVSNISIFLLYMWATLTLMYSVATWVQMLCKSAWLGAAISFGMILFPMLMGSNYQQLIEYSTNYPWIASVFLMDTPLKYLTVWDAGLSQWIDMNYFDHIVWVIGIQLLLSILLLVLSYRRNLKLDEAKKTELIYHPLFLKVVVGATCLYVVSFVVIVVFDMKSRIGECATVGLVGILFLLCFETIIKKMNERRWKG